MIEALVFLVLYLVVLGVVCWLLLFLIDSVPLPEPFRTAGRVIVIVVSVLVAILLLLQIAPLPKRLVGLLLASVVG